MHHLSVRIVPTSIGDFVCKNTRILFILLIVKESPKVYPNNYLIPRPIIPLPISHQIIKIRQFVRITIATANQQFSYCPIHLRYKVSDMCACNSICNVLHVESAALALLTILLHVLNDIGKLSFYLLTLIGFQEGK